MENNHSRFQRLMNMAVSYYISKEFLCALDCFDKVLQIDPKNKKALGFKAAI